MKDHREFQIAFSFPNPGDITSNFHYSVIQMLIYEMQKKSSKALRSKKLSLSESIKATRHLGSLYNQPPGCYVSIHRSKIADNLICAPSDTHILMIDPDISFEHSILDRIVAHLLLSEEVDILAGRVNIGNGFPVFYKDEFGGRVQQVQPFSGIKEFDGVGTGIIVISKSCLETMVKVLGHNSLFMHLMLNGREHGDDFSFCHRAKEMGFKIFGAWNIVGTHWKRQPCISKYEEKLENLAPGFK
jgi:hypothetical protein